MSKKVKGKDYIISLENLIQLEKYQYRNHDAAHIESVKQTLEVRGLDEPLRIAIIGTKEILYSGNGRATAITELAEKGINVPIRVRYDYFNSEIEMINRAVSANQGAKENIFELSKVLNDFEDFDTSNITVPSYYEGRNRKMYISAVKQLVKFPNLQEFIENGNFKTDKRKGKGLAWVYLLQSNYLLVNLIVEKMQAMGNPIISCDDIDKWIKTVGFEIKSNDVINPEKDYDTIKPCLSCTKKTFNTDVFGDVIMCYDMKCAEIKYSLEIAELKAKMDDLGIKYVLVEQEVNSFKGALKGLKIVKERITNPCSFSKKAITLKGEVAEFCDDECCPTHYVDNKTAIVQLSIDSKSEKIKKAYQKDFETEVRKQAKLKAIEVFNFEFSESAMQQMVTELLTNPFAYEAAKSAYRVTEDGKCFDLENVQQAIALEKANDLDAFSNNYPKTFRNLKQKFFDAQQKELDALKEKDDNRVAKITTKQAAMKSFLETFKDLEPEAYVIDKDTNKKLNVSEKDKDKLTELILFRLIEFKIKA